MRLYLLIGFLVWLYTVIKLLITLKKGEDCFTDEVWSWQEYTGMVGTPRAFLFLFFCLVVFYPLIFIIWLYDNYFI